MKAITLHPEFADAVADGRKTIETRPFPPNGDMRPAGVRGLPGCNVDRGERIAIHAGKPRFEIVATAVVADVALVLDNDGDDVPYRSARSALMVTQIVMSTKGLTMWEHTIDYEDPACEERMIRRNITDELPLGDFTPGRWGWVLHDVRPLAVPVPCKGRQGVWMLPADVTALVGGG